MPTILVNSYGGAVGHVNVTFISGDGSRSTYGRNYDGLDNPANGVRTEADPEQADNLIKSVPVDVSQDDFDRAYTYAVHEDAQNDGYYLVDKNCVGFADDVLQEAGLPLGSVGSLAHPGILASIYASAYGAAAGNIDPNADPNAPYAGPFSDGVGGFFPPLGMMMPNIPGWSLGDPLHPPLRDPLMIDLDGHGLDLISSTTSGVHFDLDLDGFAERVSWIRGGDGFLAIDANSNGVVDGMSELFGTPSQDGFDVLRGLDGNGDDKIDALDAAFGNLRVWRDLNQDGVSQSNEVQTLAQVGIKDIALATTISGVAVNGSQIGLNGSATTTTGGTLAVSSVYLESDRVLSEWQSPVGFALSDEAKLMPELQGYGLVKSLRAAMTLDSGLMQEVEDLVVDAPHMSGQEIRTAFEHIFQVWTATDGIEFGGRGDYVNAKHIAAVENLFGDTFIQTLRDGSVVTNPDPISGMRIEQVYADAFDITLARFVSQLPVANAKVEHVNLASENMFADILNYVGLDAQPALDSVLKYISTQANVDPNSALNTIDRELTFLRGAMLDHSATAAPATLEHLDDIASSITDPGVRGYFSQVARAIAGGGLSFVANSAAGNLFGTSSGDVLLGGAGSNQMVGGDGNDNYFYQRGGGADVITESSNVGAGDNLVLLDINPADVSLVRNGDDVTLQVAPTTTLDGTDGGSVRLVDGLVDYFDRGIDNIAFADGTTWSRLDMRVKVLDQASTSGADSITGFVNDDTLSGGKGDDSLTGGNGADTYLWARGDGSDAITDAFDYGAPTDRLLLTGVNPADVSLTRSGGDVILTIAPTASGAGDGGAIRLVSSLDEDRSTGIEKVVFDDGTTWTRADLRAQLLAQVSTPGADSITGFANADDTISAAAGADTITALTGNDSITGGAGNDVIDGGNGNDTYVWAYGDGSDTIIDGFDYSSSTDRLLLTGVNPADVALTRSGGDVILTVAPTASGAGDGGAIRLVSSLDEDRTTGIEKVVFDDGTTWTRADLRAQLLVQASTSGNDSITAFNAHDAISGGAGADTIDALIGDDTITGGVGNDIINGGNGADTFVWSRGDGSDTITDPFDYGSANDRLLLTGVNPADVTLTRSGGDVILTITPSVAGAGDGGAIKLVGNLDQDRNTGVEKIVFANGTTWTPADLRAMLASSQATPGPDSIVGTSQADILGGAGGADTIAAGGGADMITGGGGDDVLNGGTENDTYFWTRGDGSDTITDAFDYSLPTDQLLLTGVDPADVSLTRSGGDVILTVAPTASGAGDGGAIRLVSSLDEDRSTGIERVVFADGTTWTRADLRAQLLAQVSTPGADSITGFANADDTISGVAGADTITALTGNDSITGGAGNDVIDGGNGNDTYVWAHGDGSDTVTDGFDYSSSTDRLLLTGVNPADVALTRSGGDVILTVAPTASGAGDGGAIRLVSSLDEDRTTGIEKVVFDDGTTWTRADLRTMLLARQSTAGADSVTGFNTDDILTGGGGADTLAGGAGDDTYIWAHGDGMDVITEGTNGGSGDNLILQNVDPTDVSLLRNGNDITLQIAPSTLGGTDGGSVKLLVNLEDYFNQGVDKITFSDGTTWTRADLRAIAVAQQATSGADSIVGFGGNETLAGGAGADTLAGGAGDDTYIWAHGDGSDVITEGTNGGTGDNLILQNVNPADVSLVRNGNDVTLQIAPSTLGGTDGASVKLLANLDDYFNQGVDKISFGDGAAWTRADLRSMVLGQQATSGADSIVGFGGNDTLAGGGGADTLTGGGGADVFRYLSADDSRPTGFDLIADFSKGSDKIDLSALDANVGSPADNAFSFIGATAFTGHAGELRADTSSPGKTFIQGDLDGDGLSDFQIQLIGTYNLASADFIL